MPTCNVSTGMCERSSDNAEAAGLLSLEPADGMDVLRTQQLVSMVDASTRS